METNEHNESNAEVTDKIETYDTSVQEAAALLASKKHSSPEDRQALVKAVLNSSKEMTDCILAHAPGR